MTTGSDQMTRILGFWFGEIENGDVRDASKRKMWFNGTPDLDEHIRTEFLTTYESGLNGELTSWQQSARGSLALVVLLDQFPLNMFRRSKRAFESEGAAVKACQYAVSTRQDRDLELVERTFLYMPLMHAEDAVLQAESVDRYSELALSAPDHLREQAEKTLKFARSHRDIVEAFGRFPHRNAVLERNNTPEESTYLAANPPSYGQ